MENLLGEIASDRIPLLDWFRDGIELPVFNNEEDDHEMPTLDGLDDDQ